MAAKMDGIDKGSEPKGLTEGSELPNSTKILLFSRNDKPRTRTGSNVGNTSENAGENAAPNLNRTKSKSTTKTASKAGSARKLPENPTMSKPAKSTPYSWNMVEQVNLTWSLIQQGTAAGFSSMKAKSPTADQRMGSKNLDKDSSITGSPNTRSPHTGSPHMGTRNPNVASPTYISPYPSLYTAPHHKQASSGRESDQISVDGKNTMGTPMAERKILADPSSGFSTKEGEPNGENKHDNLQLPTISLPGMLPLNLSNLSPTTLGTEPLFSVTSVRSRALNSTNRDKEDQNRETFFRQFIDNLKKMEINNEIENPPAQCLIVYDFQNQVEYLDLFLESIFFYSGTCLNSEYDKYNFEQGVAKLNNCLKTFKLDIYLFLTLKECLITTLQQFLGESFNKTHYNQTQTFHQSFEEAWAILLARIETPIIMASQTHTAGHTPGAQGRRLSQKKLGDTDNTKVRAEAHGRSGTHGAAKQGSQQTAAIHGSSGDAANDRGAGSAIVKRKTAKKHRCVIL